MEKLDTLVADHIERRLVQPAARSWAPRRTYTASLQRLIGGTKRCRNRCRREFEIRLSAGRSGRI
jgi:hypothetical protein